jgi:Uma2 family endonuclease
MRGVEARRISRGEYEKMGRAGILAPDERLELIDGEIVRMTPQGHPHARAILAVEEALRRILGDRHHLRIQLPLALDPYSEPEPDVAVVRGSWRDYPDDHPATAELIVEIADSTLEHDRIRKGSIYARAGVREFWLVNLPARRLEVYRDPAAAPSVVSGWAYSSAATLGAEERVTPLVFPQSAIAVGDLLP